jgi:hypothetical protein
VQHLRPLQLRQDSGKGGGHGWEAVP